MIEKEFQKVYDLFRSNLYDSICKSDPNLTVDEAFSLEIIHMLKKPTILEYASYLGISQPNATYKINQLIKKGYLTKESSANDKRVFHLQVTDNFLSLYRKNDQYIEQVMNLVKEVFEEDKVRMLEDMLSFIAERMKGIE